MQFVQSPTKRLQRLRTLGCDQFLRPNSNNNGSDDDDDDDVAPDNDQSTRRLEDDRDQFGDNRRRNSNRSAAIKVAPMPTKTDDKQSGANSKQSRKPRDQLVVKQRASSSSKAEVEEVDDDGDDGTNKASKVSASASASASSYSEDVVDRGKQAADGDESSLAKSKK